MFQTMLQQNMMSIGRNQKACLEKTKDLKQGSTKSFEAQNGCIKETHKVIQVLDKRLSDEIVMHEDKIFATMKI